ncbi:hypothetical protein [Rhodobacter sp. SY28-1]|uniref:hypothetical protein n=1 Tax=Rhodobacter sp. SY28-1 TaxID=2562317 RepID=UPI0010C08C19|nr:hypothetical protein [Rhodobacter sp. SY28-1]
MNEKPIDRAANSAKSATAIVALVSVIAGAVGGFLSAFLLVNQQLGIWDQIKNSHVALDPVSKGTVYNHSKLGKEDIAAIRASLDLPNFEEFALKSDLWNNEQLSEELVSLGFVRFGDPLSIRDNAQPPVVLMRHETNFVSPYNEKDVSLNATRTYVWTLRKEDK